ncbi:hypothetical protein GJAV_G00206690 [Gymnothorax javanicus]|nr:hypothetical protein GJAV_G00206690 [Gymnothorax javanicus]
MDDEDEDGNFTKWMSSYWGHSTVDERAKDRRRSLRKPSLRRPPQDRRASLPCQSQLNAMQLSPLHIPTSALQPPQSKFRDKTDVKPLPRACPASTDDSSHIKSPFHSGRITTIHELSESLEKRLRFRSRNVISLSDADDLCLICHNDVRGHGVGARELHCAHHHHREGKRPEWRLCDSGGIGPGGAMSTVSMRQMSRDVPSGVEHEDCPHAHRKLSLRRQR